MVNMVARVSVPRGFLTGGGRARDNRHRIREVGLVGEAMQDEDAAVGGAI